MIILSRTNEIALNGRFWHWKQRRNWLPFSPAPAVILATSGTEIGMNEVTLAPIYHPTFPTDQKHKGAGLGFSTVYGVIKRCGDTIWGYNESVHGLTTKAYFPRIEGTVAGHRKGRETSAITTGSETMLLAAGQDVVRSLPHNALAPAECTDHEAADGKQVLTERGSHTGTMDLVLADIVMARMNGRAVAQRAFRISSHARALCMSVCADDFVGKRANLEAGNGFIQEPFVPTAMFWRVRDLLDTKQNGSRRYYEESQ